MAPLFDRKRTFSGLSGNEGIFLHRKPRSPKVPVNGNESNRTADRKDMTFEEKRGAGLGLMDLPSLRNSDEVSLSTSAGPSRSSSPKPSGQHRPHGGRRRSSILSAMRSLGSPFRNAEPSGETPAATITENPFDREALAEEVTLGSVSSHIPHVTSPIAPYRGFAVQAEVVDNRSRYAERRRAAQNAAAEKKWSKERAEEGGLFFASRSRNPSKTDVTDSETLRDAEASKSVKEPVIDYLNVNIPHISISVPDDMKNFSFV